MPTKPLSLNSDIPIPNHDKEVIDESAAPTTVTITYFLAGQQVAKKTIAYNSTTSQTTITMAY